MAGTYTVTEADIERYTPQTSQQVTIVGGQTSTVTFNNVLKRGALEVTKTSEDGSPLWTLLPAGDIYRQPLPAWRYEVSGVV